MATQPPRQTAPESPRQTAPPSPYVERAKNFLGWAFVLSIIIHLILGPIVGRYNPSHAENKEVEKVSLSKKVKVVVPTPPPPTPTPPPPTPPPKNTPPPLKSTPPPVPKLKVNVVHTTSKSNTGPSEAQYTVKQGSESGVPQGVATSAGTAKTVATPAPPATPAPTPKPACAQPHVDATTTNPVTPDTPEMAKQQGATGTVQVKVSLDPAGHVVGASVYKSSGSALLDQAAVQAAKQSSYAPEIDNCAKVAGDYIFRADFEGN